MSQSTPITKNQYKHLIARIENLEQKLGVVKKVKKPPATEDDGGMIDPEVPDMRLSKRAEKRYAKMDADIKAGRNLIRGDSPEELLRLLRE